MKRRVHLICNAHLDPVWLWEWPEGAAEAISTFRVAVELCENSHTLVFNHNEAVLYEWVRLYDPSLFDRIRKQVQAGRWRIMGGWYLQPDCNMPSGESFVRLILAGREYFGRHFGARPTAAINFDPFGHSRGLVQIMAKSGFRSYLFGRPQQRHCQLPDGPFVWVGFDGSSVLARRFTGWYSTPLGKGRKTIEARISQSNNDPEAILWGVGNHGGGPSRQDARDIDAMIAQRDDVEIIHSTPEAYFADVERSQRPLPRHEGDLNPWAPGCYTSMMRVKRKHRQLENELYLTEKLASCAAANGLITYPRADLESAGKDLMFAQFHDILPGSCNAAAEDASLRLMDHGLEILDRLKARAFFAMTRTQRQAREGHIPIIVANPHPYTVEDTVECEFCLPDQCSDGTFTDVTVLGGNGKPIASQIEQQHSNLALDWRKRIVFKTRLKPGSVSRFDCTLKVLNRKPAITRRPRNGFYIFKNDILDVRVNAATGLVDRYAVAGVNYLTQGAFCPLVLRDNEDPWEVSATAFGPVAGRFRLMDKTKGSRFSGLKNTIESVRVIEDGDVRTVIEAVLAYKESFICQRYALPKQGSEVMVETRVLWNQKNSMLKLELPLAINAKRYLGHTAFGVQTLPMNGTEAVAQKWVCAADDANGLGLTCINDGIYGSDWCGNSIRPSLLRAPAYSAHPVGNAPTCPPDRFSPRIDQGEHIFRFWINAGNIDQRLRAVSAEAQVKNERPYALSFFPKGDGSQPKPVVVLDNQAIELSCLKRAQNDDGWVFRLFNTTDCKQSLRLRLPIAGVRSTCRFGRYEIKTFRLNSDGVLSEVNLLEEEAPDACIYHNTMAGKS